MAVVVFHTMADIFGMKTLAIRAAQEGHDENLSVVVVDVDVEPYDGSHIPHAQKNAEQSRYDSLTLHFPTDKFTKNMLILCN